MTSNEMHFALETVKMFKEKWEEKEKMNLEGDIILRLDMYKRDRKYRDYFESLDAAEMEKQIDEELNANEEIDVASLDEETKIQYQNQIKLRILTRQFFINEKDRKRVKLEQEIKAKKEAEILA